MERLVLSAMDRLKGRKLEDAGKLRNRILPIFVDFHMEKLMDFLENHGAASIDWLDFLRDLRGI